MSLTLPARTAPPPDDGRPWVEDPLPEGRLCWTWQPSDLSHLPGVRRELRAHLTHASVGTPQLDAEQVVGAVAALDELMSNAFRHGLAPVRVAVSAVPEGVLLVVTDHAPAVGLSPTSTRDPGLGGMGLGMVAADACSTGCTTDGAVKHVWAVLPGRGPARPLSAA